MILALCGTVEGRELLKKIPKRFSPILATVTTPYGVECLGEYPHVEVLQKKLQQEELLQLIDNYNIKVVIDVSHPYAEVISNIAMEACREKGLTYLRYEREETKTEEDPSVIYAEDFYHATQMAKGFKGKIFLTIGSNRLPLFIKELGSNRLIARVLPVSKVLHLCEEQGLLPDQIIAIKGPFSEEINRAMFAMEGVSVVITKDSGEAGGTLEKITAAKAVGVPIIIVRRPKISYGTVFNRLDFLVESLNKL